jgi:hypothetical protein
MLNSAMKINSEDQQISLSAMQTELLLVFLLSIIIVVSGIALSPDLGASDQTITTSLSLPTQTIPDFNFAAVGDWECTSHTIDTVNNILEKNLN